jgi:capsular exopolysaccharide synthesis family protein
MKPEDTVSSLYRQKWVALLFILGAVGAALCYNTMTKPIYRAETTLLFGNGDGTGAPFGLPRSLLGADTRLANKVQEVRSRSVVEDVLQRDRADAEKAYPIPVKPPPEFSADNYLIRHLRAAIDVEAIGESDVIRISVQGNDPGAVQRLARTVTDVVEERNLDERHSEFAATRSFLDTQLVSYQGRLRTAEDRLRGFKEENHISELSQEAEEILKRLTQADALRNESLADHDAASRKLERLRENLQEQRATVIPSVLEISTPRAQKLKGHLIELEAQYSTLQVQEYSSDHPKMRELRSQIEETRKNLTAEALKISQGENPVDPLSQIQESVEQAIRLELDLQALGARQKTLEGIIAQYNQELSSLPRKELELAQLTREKTVSEKIFLMILERSEEARIAEAGRLSNVRVIDPARASSLPVRPRKLMNLLLALACGGTAGIATALVLDRRDPGLRGIDGAEEATGLKVLGTIPRSKRWETTVSGSRASKAESPWTGRRGPTPTIEAFRTLRVSLDQALSTDRNGVILVSSVAPGEGKSTIAAQLAIATAQAGVPTLLVDGDMRRCRIAPLFGRLSRPGLSDVLAGSKALEDVVQGTGTPGLSLLAAGHVDLDPTALLHSPRFRTLVSTMRDRFQHVIIDSPPILGLADSLLLAPACDTVLLIAESEKTKASAVHRARLAIERAGGNVVGLVLNKIDPRLMTGYAYSYYYRHSYGHARAHGTRREQRKREKAA